MRTERLALVRKFDLDDAGYLYALPGAPDPPSGFTMAFVYRGTETAEQQVAGTAREIGRVEGVQAVETVGDAGRIVVDTPSGPAEAVQARYCYTFRGTPMHALRVLLPPPAGQPWVKVRLSYPAAGHSFEQLDAIARELLGG